MRVLLLCIVVGMLGATTSAQNFPDIRDNDVSYDHYFSAREIVDYGQEPRLWDVRHPMLRAEFAEYTNAMLMVIEGQLNSDASLVVNRLFEDDKYRVLLSENFWHIEFLIRNFRKEFLAIGVTDTEIRQRLIRVKRGFTEHGIVLHDPYNERFTDVPEEHWADEAIHNLRRAGILYGYPNGQFLELRLCRRANVPMHVSDNEPKCKLKVMS